MVLAHSRFLGFAGFLTLVGCGKSAAENTPVLTVDMPVGSPSREIDEESPNPRRCPSFPGQDMIDTGSRFAFVQDLSHDGNFVVFTTETGAGEERSDVFVRDHSQKITSLLAGSARGSSISGDGRYVVIDSTDPHLVPRDTNGRKDVFLHDRQTGAFKRISVGPAGQEGNEDSFAGLITPDGAFVAFSSSASNLVPGDTNSESDIFLFHRETETIERVSVATGGLEADGPSHPSSISEDGRFVAFSSYAENLVPGDTNRIWDLFVHDREKRTTARVSLDPQGHQTNDIYEGGQLSRDGAWLLFKSKPFMEGMKPTRERLFLRNQETGLAELVFPKPPWDVSLDYLQVDRFSMSGDARFVSFAIASEELFESDVYVIDRQDESVRKISVPKGGHLSSPQISGDGCVIAFTFIFKEASTCQLLIMGAERFLAGHP